jgi:hypothetical protein
VLGNGLLGNGLLGNVIPRQALVTVPALVQAAVKALVSALAQVKLFLLSVHSE